MGLASLLTINKAINIKEDDKYQSLKEELLRPYTKLLRKIYIPLCPPLFSVLKKVGEFLHISKAGNIIVKANPSNLPKVGSEVVDRKMRKVGFIYDIIGPVNQPYLVVKSYEDVEFKNLELFVVLEYGRNGKSKGERSRKGGRKKGNRKRRND